MTWAKSLPIYLILVLTHNSGCCSAVHHTHQTVEVLAVERAAEGVMVAGEGKEVMVVVAVVRVVVVVKQSSMAGG